MKFTINGNGRENKVIRGISFQRLNIVANLDAAADTSTDWSKINLKMVLKRGGKSFQICDDNLQRLGLFLNFDNSHHVTALSPWITSQVTTAPAVACVMSLDFGVVINITNADSLSVEIRHQNAWQGVTATTAGSSVTYEFRPTVGNGPYIPLVKFEPVKAASSTYEADLGSNISRIAINSPELFVANYNPATRLVNNARLESDKLNLDEDILTLGTRRAEFFESTTNAEAREGNFYYIPDVPLDNVKLKLNLRSAGITSENLWISYLVQEFDAETWRRAAERAQRHGIANSAKIPM